ncbi:MAG: radical SAM protein [candidate division WOR-3 bacterium]
MPVYLKTDLETLSQKAMHLLEHCTICPRRCGVNRLKGELGHCQVGKDAIVSSFGPHFGEEPELVATNGSGTIFFAFCNLNCVFCQNYDISQLGHGQVVTANELSEIMLKLQKIGCHNINLVSPTHIVPQFLQALCIAKDKGLNLPIVYNSGGYDSVETLKLLEGVIDIYMPDAKYGSNEMGEKYSNAPNYFEINKAVLKEMHRQVGDLIVNEKGIAQRGLLVRHLVLPNRLAESFKVLKFIAEEISLNTYVNIMDQYRPCYKVEKYPELARRIYAREYQEVIEYARKLGLRNY